MDEASINANSFSFQPKNKGGKSQKNILFGVGCFSWIFPVLNFLAFWEMIKPDKLSSIINLNPEWLLLAQGPPRLGTKRPNAIWNSSWGSCYSQKGRKSWNPLDQIKSLGNTLMSTNHNQWIWVFFLLQLHWANSHELKAQCNNARWLRKIDKSQRNHFGPDKSRSWMEMNQQLHQETKWPISSTKPWGLSILNGNRRKEKARVFLIRKRSFSQENADLFGWFYNNIEPNDSNANKSQNWEAVSLLFSQRAPGVPIQKGENDCFFETPWRYWANLPNQINFPALN